MNSDEADLNFTHEDLKQLASDDSLFIVRGHERNIPHRMTALQYLMKINLLFIYSINNNN